MLPLPDCAHFIGRAGGLDAGVYSYQLLASWLYTVGMHLSFNFVNVYTERLLNVYTTMAAYNGNSVGQL